jgi:hypothetical protein
MALRGLVIGIIVWVSAALIPSVSLGGGVFSGEKLATEALQELSQTVTQSITESTKHLKSEKERSAIKQILAELDNKSNRELLTLRLTPQICEELDCRGASSNTVRRYVEVYAAARITEDTLQTALRNAEAAERSTFIAATSASVSLVSVFISILSYRRTVRSAKSAMPA